MTYYSSWPATAGATEGTSFTGPTCRVCGWPVAKEATICNLKSCAIEAELADAKPADAEPEPDDGPIPYRVVELDPSHGVFGVLADLVQPTDPHVLSTDSEERKNTPIFSGVLNYFPLAMAALARHSKRGNDKHNPGEALHWARGKSMDHADCIARHLIDHLTVDPITGENLEAVALLWRAAALVQELEEKRLNKPMSRGSK